MNIEKPGQALTMCEETIVKMQSLLFEVELLRNASDLISSFDPNLVENALDRNLQELLSCVGVMECLRAYLSSQEYVLERYRHIQAVQGELGEG